jgi:hypothetical protein
MIATSGPYIRGIEKRNVSRCSGSQALFEVHSRECGVADSSMPPVNDTFEPLRCNSLAGVMEGVIEVTAPIEPDQTVDARPRQKQQVMWITGCVERLANLIEGCVSLVL